MPSAPTDPLAARPAIDFDPDPDAGRSIGSPSVQRVSPATPLGLVGEFTPELEEDEVEIVSIRLASTLGDLPSVRAWPDGEQVSYDVVGECDGEFEPGIRTSAQLLTGHEIGKLLRGNPSTVDDRPLFHDFFEPMANEPDRIESPESVATGQAFVPLESNFYPDLNPWLAEWYRDWLEPQRNRAAPRG